MKNPKDGENIIKDLNEGKIELSYEDWYLFWNFIYFKLNKIFKINLYYKLMQ
jgi:hypothetical protein